MMVGLSRGGISGMGRKPVESMILNAGAEEELEIPKDCWMDSMTS